MKIFSVIMLIALCGSVGALARPMGIEESEGVQPSKLLQASVIVVGRVDSTRDAGQTILSVGYPMEVNVAKTTINVLQVVNGEPIKTVQITNMISSSSSVDSVKLQNLELNKTYVFFLTKLTETEFDPISPYQFALPLEISPKTINTSNSVKESLRDFGKENVAATNNSISETWARFLRGLYDNNEDLTFWTNKINDNRIFIRAIALVTLAENAPQTPGLYSEVVKFLDSAKTDIDIFLIQRQIFQLLPKLASRDEPSVVDLQNWIGGKSEQFKEAALECIQKTRDVRLMADVVQLMTRSKDRNVQYDCIKTLYVLTENPHLISYPMFLKQPDDYIKEWQTVGGKPAKN
jgi:hypothetical protein